MILKETSDMENLLQFPFRFVHGLRVNTNIPQQKSTCFSKINMNVSKYCKFDALVPNQITSFIYLRLEFS